MARNSTLCYIENDGKRLLLHRTKKKNDVNAGKWIGVGGGFEDGESPEDCMKREIAEETGLTVTEWQYRGIVTFVNDACENEYMHLFTVSGFTGEIIECNEGDLVWVDFETAETLPTWEGDRIFNGLLKERRSFFSLKLVYHGDTLLSAELDGKPYAI